jgi:hypothetical protein
MLQTVEALEREGFSPSVLAGKGGAWKAQKTILQTAEALEREGFSLSLLAGAGGAAKAQRMLLQTAGDLERAGFSPSVLVGNGGAAKAQKTMLQTARDFSAAGIPLSVLSGSCGSKLASDMFLLTRQSLRDNKLPESLIASNAGRSAKAQGTIVATSLELRGMGFSNDDIAMMLRGNNASFTCQRALLDAIKCIQSETPLKRKSIVLLLRGGKYSNAKVLQALGEITVKLLVAGIQENALLTRLGRYSADPAGRLTSATILLRSL